MPLGNRGRLAVSLWQVASRACQPITLGAISERRSFRQASGTFCSPFIVAAEERVTTGAGSVANALGSGLLPFPAAA